MSSRSGGYPPAERDHRVRTAEDYPPRHYDDDRRPRSKYQDDLYREEYQHTPGGSSSYHESDRRGSHSYSRDRYERRPEASPEPVRRSREDRPYSHRESRAYDHEVARRREYEDEKKSQSTSQRSYDADRYDRDRRKSSPDRRSHDDRRERDRPSRSEKESSHRDDRRSEHHRRHKEDERKERSYESNKEYDKRSSISRQETPPRSKHKSSNGREEREEQGSKDAKYDRMDTAWSSSDEEMLRVVKGESNGKAKAKGGTMPMEEDAFERLSSKKVEKISRTEAKVNGHVRDDKRSSVRESETTKEKERDRQRERERARDRERERSRDRDRERYTDREVRRDREDERERERYRDHSSRRKPDKNWGSDDGESVKERKEKKSSPAPDPSTGSTDKTSRIDSRHSQAASAEQNTPPPPPPLEERPLSPPPPPPSPPPLSFKDVKLPHELLKPENEALLPKNKEGKALMPFKVTYDPALDKTKAGKHVVKTSKFPDVTKDPRKKWMKRKGVRKEVRFFTWKWDSNSTKPKPPPPPRAIVVSRLSSLTTLATIRQHFGVYGRIEGAETKLDSKTGEPSGIFYLRFCQDYDEDLRVKEGEEEASAQRGDLIAKEAVQKVDNQTVDKRVVRVVLDNDEKSHFIQTYKEEMERRHSSAPPPKPKVATTADALSTGVVNGLDMPPPNAPKGLTPSAPRGPRNINGPPTTTSTPPLRSGYPPNGLISRTNLNSSARSPLVSHSSSNTPSHGTASPASFADPRDSHHRRGETWDRDEVRVDEIRQSFKSTPVPRGRPNHLYNGASTNQRVGYSGTTANKLIQNGHLYLFIARHNAVTFTDISKRFKGFSPHLILRETDGWYLAFNDDTTAERCQAVSSAWTFGGHRLTIEVRDPRDLHNELDSKYDPDTEASPLTNRKSTHPSSKKTAVVRRPAKSTWTNEELFADARLLLLRDLGTSFMREVKTRIIKPFIDDFIKPGSVGGQAINAPTNMTVEEAEDEESEIEVEEEQDWQRGTTEEDLGMQKAHRTGDTLMKKEALEKEAEVDEEARAKSTMEEGPEKVQSKPVKGKKGKKSKSNRTMEGEVETSVPGAGEDEVTTTVRVKTKKATKPNRQRSPSLDPFTLGIAEDEEDLYYLRLTLEKMKEGYSATEVHEEAMAAVEALEEMEPTMGANGLPRHLSGSARTEGFYRIPPAEKALHLPDRNRAVVDPASAVGLASARDNRADSRKFVQGIEQHKKETATDTDILKFNQLRSRKKQLKFAKSPIHDWGLYAMELIPAGDMVIEYVGEIVRQQIADQREKMYERQGNFSTYLFRVDDDVVVDATKKGNIARLMNHCCTPNCNAKILTLNGEKRIVLYAKNPILPGQELTYDYKFQATGDEEDAIACLCGSPGCRRFL